MNKLSPGILFVDKFQNVLNVGITRQNDHMCVFRYFYVIFSKDGVNVFCPVELWDSLLEFKKWNQSL